MNTKNYTNPEAESDPQASIEIIKQAIRGIGGLVGVIAIVVGVVYVAKLMDLIFTLLSAPEGGQRVLAFAELLGGASLELPSAHGPVPFAMPLAVVFYIAGLLMVGWLALGLIITGAKVVSYCLTDRKSIKELLTYAFGPKAKPEERGGKKSTAVTS